ncbi:MAG: glycosyltransferase family 2 protein [Nitrospira sp.]
MSVSILILTLNEQMNLGACLETVSWCDDVVVLDSNSVDGTVVIAREKGARVIQRDFDNWATHQNWALNNIVFKHPWVFYLDADERMTDELKQEILTISEHANETAVAYYCGRKNFFMGRWIRHAMPPGMIMRFFKPAHVRFERLVNPTPIVNGPHGYLNHHFLHYNFSKGLGEWFEKHNKYSALEAMEGIKLLKGTTQYRSFLFSRDRATRRKALKELSFRFPCRSLLKFSYLYVIKFGFLDGRPGFTYCVLQSIYEYMIALKMKEFQRKEQGLPV